MERKQRAGERSSGPLAGDRCGVSFTDAMPIAAANNDAREAECAPEHPVHGENTVVGAGHG
jgi:hypothetical protein